MTPTHDQLCTLCDKAEDYLRRLTLQLDVLRKDIATLEKHIIAQQGVLAAFKVATGESYDPTTVPMPLDLT